jgi:Flp pilus assembly protein TadG
MGSASGEGSRVSVSYARAIARLTSRRHVCSDRGAVAVEFALIVPMFLLIVLGMIQYGMYFWAAQGGSTAAREAARRAAVGDFATCDQFRADVRARIDSLGDVSTAVVKRSYQKGPGNTDTAVEVGDVVTVTVEFHTTTFELPFIPFPDEGMVKQTADARVENVPTAAVEACT